MKLLSSSTLALTLTALFMPVAFVYAQETTQFVPLTTLPGLDTISESNNIAQFLNNLYKIAIGAAAVLAVLQITRAGLMYMTEESISEKKEARNIIKMTFLGLLLVLSPAVVFGIIDPRILNLEVDISSLRSSGGEGNAQQGSGSGNGQGVGQTGADAGRDSSAGDTTPPEETEDCGASGGTITESGRCVHPSVSVEEGEPDTSGVGTNPSSGTTSFTVGLEGCAAFAYYLSATLTSTGTACNAAAVNDYTQGCPVNQVAVMDRCEADANSSFYSGKVRQQCTSANSISFTVPNPVCGTGAMRETK